MLFSSWEFVAVFLPLMLLAYRWLPSAWALQGLVLGSLLYYGWWNPIYLLLILGSTGFNYLLGGRIALAAGRHRTLLTALGVVANLATLAYFKYLDFLIISINQVSTLSLPLQHVALPLAISFFTFQQIAYLVDVSRGELRVRSLWEYCLFVSFFPQLIAGPIVHYREMIPQFQALGQRGVSMDNLSIGIAVFVAGLFKKTVIADGLGTYADAVFQFADAGGRPSFTEAWAGALAYTFQLYFDFSGYADMAIGSARMFGIVLPANFNSPYKATSIIDFWRRWHMTLSRFLRDYLYIALGGNRHGRARRYVNLFLTMLLGGLWHGAGWNFVLWGGLHGAMLTVNHLWAARFGHRPLRTLGWALTFGGVVIGWVLFRAETFAGATRMLSVMALADGVALPARWLGLLGDWSAPLRALGLLAAEGPSSHGLITSWYELIVLVCAAAALALLAPNTQEIFARWRVVLEPVRASAIAFRFTPAWAFVAGVASFFALLYMTTRGHVEFIYRFF